MITDFTPQHHQVTLTSTDIVRATDLVYKLMVRRYERPVIDIWDFKHLEGFTDDQHKTLEHCVQSLVEFGHIRIFKNDKGIEVFEILIKKLKKRMTTRRVKYGKTKPAL
jgi:hypothetical protein